MRHEAAPGPTPRQHTSNDRHSRLLQHEHLDDRRIGLCTRRGPVLKHLHQDDPSHRHIRRCGDKEGSDVGALVAQILRSECIVDERFVVHLLGREWRVERNALGEVVKRVHGGDECGSDGGWLGRRLPAMLGPDRLHSSHSI